MIKNQLFIGSALLAGVAIGYLMKPEAPREAAVEEKGYVAAGVIDDKGGEASLKALKARIAELEGLLEKKVEVEGRVRADAGKDEETLPGDGEKGERRGPPSMKEMRQHMEKWAKEHPEEFSKMTNAMARWRQRRVERAHKKLDLLSSVDTSTMTAKQKEAHERFQDLLVRREELEEKMQNPEMTDEDREDIMRDMHETGRAMREAAKVERETLLNQTVQSLGYSGEDAAEISATLSEIISVTDSRGGGPGGPGAGGPGAGGPPPGGGQP